MLFSDTIGTYSHYVYSLMDTTDSGRITFTVKNICQKVCGKIFQMFQDFVRTLSVLEKGSLLERMTWISRLYDLDGDGIHFKLSYSQVNRYLGIVYCRIHLQGGPGGHHIFSKYFEAQTHTWWPWLLLDWR